MTDEQNAKATRPEPIAPEAPPVVTFAAPRATPPPVAIREPKRTTLPPEFFSGLRSL